jgi:hypothetical protein
MFIKPNPNPVEFQVVAKNRPPARRRSLKKAQIIPAKPTLPSKTLARSARAPPKAAASSFHPLTIGQGGDTHETAKQDN